MVLKFHPPQEYLDHSTFGVTGTFAVAALKEIVREPHCREAMGTDEVSMPASDF
jgi:hypothetical protein